MCKTPIFDTVYSNPAWPELNNFMQSPLRRVEHEKHLEFLKKHGQLDRFLPRLARQTPEQRDEAIAEIEAAYYLETFANLPIVAWEPPGKGNKVLEFMVRTQDDKKIACEVKSPGWEYEVVEQEGRNSPRLQETKFSRSSGFTNPSESIFHSAGKASEKFHNDQPSLWIVNDDLVVSFLMWPRAEDMLPSVNKNIGGILVLNVLDVCGEGIQYKTLYQKNPTSFPKCQIPTSVSFPEKLVPLRYPV